MNPNRDTVLRTSPKIKQLLGELHAQHSEQQESFTRKFLQLRSLFFVLTHWGSRAAWDNFNDRYEIFSKHCRKKTNGIHPDNVPPNFYRTAKRNVKLCEQVSTEESVAQIVNNFSYMLAVLNKATSIIECGTSFGLSTIYLALAINHNVSGKRKDTLGVFTIEKDGRKVEGAKKIWARAGSDVNDWISPRQGDVLEILDADKSLPQTVDLLFLDGESPLHDRLSDC